MHVLLRSPSSAPKLWPSRTSLVARPRCKPSVGSSTGRASGADPRRARRHRQDHRLAGGPGARTAARTSSAHDACLRGGAGSRYGRPRWISWAMSSTNSATRCPRRSGPRLRWRCCASTCDDGEVHPWDGVGSRARARSPGSGGVTSPGCGRRPAVAGQRDCSDADLHLAKTGDAPVLLLATARSEDGARDAQPASISGQQMLIPPLDIGSLSRLIARELGSAFRGSSCAGSPPWRQATPSSQLNSPASRRCLATTPTSYRPRRCRAPLTSRRLAETRVRVLPEPTRKALAIVAALGEPRAPTLARALHDEAALDPAFDAGVIAEQGGRVRFTHPLLAAGALTRLAPWRRRSIHRGLADLADTSEERARHLAVADDRAVRRDRLRDRGGRQGLRSRVARPPRRRSCSRRPSWSEPRGGRPGDGGPPRPSRGLP